MGLGLNLLLASAISFLLMSIILVLLGIFLFKDDSQLFYIIGGATGGLFLLLMIVYIIISYSKKDDKVMTQEDEARWSEKNTSVFKDSLDFNSLSDRELNSLSDIDYIYFKDREELKRRNEYLINSSIEEINNSDYPPDVKEQLIKEKNDLEESLLHKEIDDFIKNGYI